MELKNLAKHIRALATLPETSAPVISCYAALGAGRLEDPGVYEQQVRSLKDSLTGQASHIERIRIDGIKMPNQE